MENFDKQAFLDELSKPKKPSHLIVGICVLGLIIFLGAFVGTFVYPDPDSNTATRIIFGIGAAAFLWGLYASLKKYNPETDSTLIEIKKGGDNIVWIYPYNQTNSGYTSYWVKFMTKEGKTILMPTVTQEQQEYVINGLSKLYTDAVLGYTSDLEKEMQARYKR